MQSILEKIQVKSRDREWWRWFYQRRSEFWTSPIFERLRNLTARCKFSVKAMGIHFENKHRLQVTGESEFQKCCCFQRLLAHVPPGVMKEAHFGTGRRFQEPANGTGDSADLHMISEKNQSSPFPGSEKQPRNPDLKWFINVFFLGSNWGVLWWLEWRVLVVISSGRLNHTRVQEDSSSDDDAMIEKSAGTQVRRASSQA